MENEKLILITNDDGYDAPGIHALVESVQRFGKILVVAPIEAQSGMGHAITIKYPLRIKKISENENLRFYKCEGTPVDCVKIALDQLLDRKPDLILSGINHGINTSISVVYSGTISAALEGAINEIPSIGFSLNDLKHEADFSASKIIIEKVVEDALLHGIPKGICLNVNIPRKAIHEIKGIKSCRQAKGLWVEEFEKRTDPGHRDYYWLTGNFYNLEEDSVDTDEWAIRNNYVSIVPMQADMTCHKSIEYVKKWDKSF